MKLHRASKKADWETVAPEKRSVWQWLGAKTHGVITPANGVSLLGVAFVGLGLLDISQGRLGLGITEIVLGRIADIVDGWLAENTHTKSPLGEALDATIDKLVLFAVLIVFVQEDILPILPAGLIVAQAATVAMISVIARYRKRRLQPSRQGKWVTAALWAGLLCYGFAALIHAPWLVVIASGITVGGVVMGFVAALSYWRTVATPSNHAK